VIFVDMSCFAWVTRFYTDQHIEGISLPSMLMLASENKTYSE
jgi:hypothetical protein